MTYIKRHACAQLLMHGGSACGSISNGTSERRYSRGKTNCAREAEDSDDGRVGVTFECVHRRVTAHESNLFQGPELSRAFLQRKVEPKLYHY